MKKYILGLVIALTAPVFFAYAATPTLSVSGQDDNNNVTVRVTGGEIDSPVELFYNRLVGSLPERRTIGTTDMNGSFTGTVSTSALGITQISPVYVQVGGYQSLPVNWPYSSVGSPINSNAIVFSPNSPTFSVGQNGAVTISGGGSGTYYIASNSDPNFTSASISGNTLTLHGTQSGQSSVTVCSTAGPCAVISPNFSAVAGTPGGGTGTTSSPTLSATTVNVPLGGQGAITLSGGTAPYSVSVISGNDVSTTLIGNTLYINGNMQGTTAFNICSASTSSTTGTACSQLTVNVAGGGQTATSTQGAPIAFSLPLASGETIRLSLSGGTGSYYIQPTGGVPVAANLNGSMLTLVGSTVGQATINVCSTGTPSASTACLPIRVAVSPALTGTGGGFLFESTMYMGMSGPEVMELQNRLRTEGFFNVTPTGYFGPLTESAVKAYQSANGLPSVGIVGPLTRELLNQ